MWTILREICHTENICSAYLSLSTKAASLNWGFFFKKELFVHLWSTCNKNSCFISIVFCLFLSDSFILLLIISTLTAELLYSCASQNKHIRGPTWLIPRALKFKIVEYEFRNHIRGQLYSINIMQNCIKCFSFNLYTFFCCFKFY